MSSANTAQDWPFSDVLDVLFSGLGVVFSVLLLIFLSTYLIGRSFKTAEARKAEATKAKATPSPSTPAAQPEVASEDNAHLVAILTAAAMEALEEQVKIVKIRKITSNITDWSLQGRTNIHSSHRLR